MWNVNARKYANVTAWKKYIYTEEYVNVGVK